MQRQFAKDRSAVIIVKIHSNESFVVRQHFRQLDHLVKATWLAYRSFEIRIVMHNVEPSEVPVVQISRVVGKPAVIDLHEFGSPVEDKKFVIRRGSSIFADEEPFDNQLRWYPPVLPLPVKS